MSDERYSLEDVHKFMSRVSKGHFLKEPDPDYRRQITQTAKKFIYLDKETQTRVARIICHILNYQIDSQILPTLSSLQVESAINGVKRGQRIRAQIEQN